MLNNNKALPASGFIRRRWPALLMLLALTALATLVQAATW